jgi:tetratricopeptide (TPR) repeat protein
VKLASAARAAGKLDSARHELEVALKEWPGAAPVLELLIQVLREMKDTVAELQHARELAAAQTDGGAVEGALKTMERVLELAPDDADARRRYADLCLRAHLKEKAIEILERDAHRAKREGSQNDLAAIYKRILAIDGGRKDIKRALGGLRRSKTDRLLRLGAVTLLVCALLSLGGFVGLRFHHKTRGVARLQEAAGLLATGDITGARAIVDEVLADDPRPEVAHEAMALLDRIDDRVADSTRGKRSQREEQLSEKLATIQIQAERMEFDTAIAGCVELLHDESEPYLRDRVETRLQMVVTKMLDLVERAKSRSDSFRPPERDEDVGPVYARMAEAFPVALITALPRVHDEAFAAAKMLEGEPREWMHQVLAAVDAFDLMQTKMRPQLEALRTRHVRLQTLQQLSVEYLEAARAAEAGNVERSRELLRKVLEEYGQGQLSDLLQQRLTRLDSAATAVQRIEGHIAHGEYDAAYAEARKAADEFKDLQIPSTLSVPVLVDSLPHGAKVRAGGQDLGVSPCVVRVTVGQPVGVSLTMDGRDVQSFDVDADGGARRMVEIPRHARARGKVEGSAQSAPIHEGERFVVAGRDGTFHEVKPRPDGTLGLRTFRTGSISGSHAAPVAVRGGFVAAVFEGKVFRIDARGAQLTAPWTRDLAEEIRFAPIVVGEEVLVVTAARIVALALGDGSIAWQVPLESRRAAGSPAFVSGRLFLPLVGGSIAGISVALHRIEFERPCGDELVVGLATDGLTLVGATSTGELLKLDVSTAEVRGRVALGDTPIDLPRVGGGLADIALGKDVVRVDLDRMVETRSWHGLEPTAAPLLVDGKLWIPCAKGVISVVDPTTDAVVEREHLGTGALAGSPVLTPDGIALLARDGAFELLAR